jgi:hypothetical protein
MLADAIQSAGTIMFIMAVALASGRWMTIPEPASLLKFALGGFTLAVPMRFRVS